MLIVLLLILLLLRLKLPQTLLLRMPLLLLVGSLTLYMESGVTVTKMEEQDRKLADYILTLQRCARGIHDPHVPMCYIVSINLWSFDDMTSRLTDWKVEQWESVPLFFVKRSCKKLLLSLSTLTSASHIVEDVEEKKQKKNYFKSEKMYIQIESQKEDERNTKIVLQMKKREWSV